MTEGQYRALVAYLLYWTPMYPASFGFDQALIDIGITVDKEEAARQLFKAGWNWDDETSTLNENDGQGDEAAESA